MSAPAKGGNDGFAGVAAQGARGRQEDYCGVYSAEGAVLAVLADGMGGREILSGR